jgi:hypothetical protein
MDRKASEGGVPPGTQDMERSEKVWQVCVIVIAGLVAALGYHQYQAHYLGAGYPFDTFLFRPEVTFSDFFDIFAPVQAGSPLSSKLAVYFPFAYVPLYPLIWLTPGIALAVVLLLFSACTFHFFWRRLGFLKGARRLVAAFTLAFATYPFLFCVSRANLEMIVLLFTFLFVALFERGKYVAAGSALACAIAMKLYPGVLGVLLLQRRRYKAAAVTAAVTLVLTLAAAASFPGGVRGSVELLANNLHHFREDYALTARSTQFSASYFSVVKLFGAAAGADIGVWARSAWLAYTIFCLAAFSAIVVFILRWDCELWKQVALLAICAVVLPEVSFDYRLIHMLVPLGLFLSAPAGSARDDRVYATLFGLLLIPKAYVPLGYDLTISVFLNPLLMTLMAGYIIWSRLRARARDVEVA